MASRGASQILGRAGGQAAEGEEVLGRGPSAERGGASGSRGPSQPPQQGQGQAGAEPGRAGGLR